MDKVPGAAEWGPETDDLDLRHARKNFFGKTRAEAAALFANSDVIERADELRRMPPAPFRYYALAFSDYVQSPALKSDRSAGSQAPDAAAIFLDLVAAKLETEPAATKPVLPELLAAAEHVAARQKTYRARPSIYGRFGEKIRSIRRLAKKAQGGA